MVSKLLGSRGRISLDVGRRTGSPWRSWHAQTFLWVEESLEGSLDGGLLDVPQMLGFHKRNRYSNPKGFSWSSLHLIDTG